MDATDIAREGRERKVLDTEVDDPTAEHEADEDKNMCQQIDEPVELEGVTA